MRLLHEIAIFQTVKSKVIISLFETVKLSVSILLRNLYNSLNSIKEILCTMLCAWRRFAAATRHKNSCREDRSESLESLEGKYTLMKYKQD